MDWRRRGLGLRIGGHRGAREAAPENTIAGFEAALAAGADYLENDVRRSADGALLVIHDDSVDRTTNGHGEVARLTLAELQALDAGSAFGPTFAGERMPTLDEFLRWIEARPPLGAVIEAKSSGVGAEIAEAIARSSARDHLSICSFSADEIRAAKAARPEVPCILLFGWRPHTQDPIALTRGCGADGADLPWPWLDASLAARVHEAGLLLGGGTASDGYSISLLMARQADFVDTEATRAAVQARDAATAAMAR